MLTQPTRERFHVLPLRSRLASYQVEERAVQALSTLLGEPVERAASAQAADALLLCSGGVEEECTTLLQNAAARLLIAGPEQNAYASAAEVAAWARRQGMPLHIEPLGEHNGAALRCWLRGQQSLERLRDARLGLLGGSAPWLVASIPSAAALRARFGVNLVTIPWPELTDLVGDDFPFRKAPAAERWTVLPRDAELSSQDMRRALGFSAALGQAVRQRQFAAVAVDCFPLVTKLRITGCLGLADLEEDGIPAACEGDISAAMAKLICRTAVGQVSWMANLIFQEEATVWLAHCTAPPSMGHAGRLQRHFETGDGVALGTRFPGDQRVTLLRLSEDLREAVLVRGRIRDVPPSPDRCRTQACVDLEAPLPAMLGNHHIMVLGDHILPLRAVLYLAGVKVIE